MQGQLEHDHDDAQACAQQGPLHPGRPAASCSARVTPNDFLGAIKEAGFKAGVDLALVEERYQPPDHPVRLQFGEGRYLKFYVLAAV